MNKVGIIIPTLNRLDFVQRLIKYYLFCNDQVSVYIGDASNNDSSNKLKSIIDNKSVCKIYYYHFPKLNDAKTIYKLSTLVKEKYICFSGDDDFFITKSLIKCANFLEKNNNYRSVQGRAYVFETNNNELYQKVSKMHSYWNKIEINENFAYKRALHLSKNYFVPEFSVNRTQNFIEDKKPSIEIIDRNIREYMSSFSILINGKSKFLDCLYMLRQHHPNRGVSSVSNHYSEKKTREIFDSNSIDIFKKFIEKSLIKKDNISTIFSLKCLDGIMQNLNIYEIKDHGLVNFIKKTKKIISYTYAIYYKLLSLLKKQRFQIIKFRHESELKNFLSFIEKDFYIDK